MSFFLVFLAVTVLGVTFFFGTDIASKFRNRGVAARTVLEQGFDEPVASLPPVLLPANPLPADVDHIRFALGLRGYRMDQVDQVLDELRDQLAEKDAEIARLRAALASPGSGPFPGSAMRATQEEGS